MNTSNFRDARGFELRGGTASTAPAQRAPVTLNPRVQPYKAQTHADSEARVQPRFEEGGGGNKGMPPPELPPSNDAAGFFLGG